MKIFFSAVSMLTLAFSAAAAISENDLWFFTDFDGRTQLNGSAVTLKTSPDGIVAGRYGKGCYFHRPVKNTLPPMSVFVTASTNFTVTGGSVKVIDAAKGRIALSGGTLTVAPQKDPLAYSWVVPQGGATCSLYVKGAKGTKVTLTPSISPTLPEAVKTATKKIKGFDPKKQVQDTVVASTNVMDGTWKRVWAGVRHDCRTTDGRLVSLKIDATGPVEMERFQYEQSAVFPYIGNLVPALWTEGGTRRVSEAAEIKDPLLLGNFPAERGSASFWVRSISNDWANTSCRAFAFSDAPKLEYSYDGDFRPGSWANRIIPNKKSRLRRSDAWQHVTVTWAPSNQCIYINGELRQNEHRNYQPGKADGKRRSLRIGTATNGTQPTDAILDEVAIFRRDLTADEVAELAGRKEGLLANSRTLLATEVNFPFFWRNEPAAALRCTVRALAPTEVKLVAEVGGKPLPPRTLKLVAGDNALAVAFDPSRYRPGKYAWSFVLEATGTAEKLLSRSGELEIFGRFDREAPTYVSWGGNHPVPNDFLVLAGMNAKNVYSTDLPAIRELVKLGIVPNIRYENSGKWKTYDFDDAAIEKDTLEQLAPYAGLFLWNQTLINSEVYGTWVFKEAKKLPKFLARAEQAIGMRPDFTFGDAPSQVRWKDLGMKPPRGTIGDTNATLRTLRWCIDRGQPVYQINAANRRAIHRLSPGNVVWTEPVYGGGISEDVDMMADWYYSYDVDDNLMGQRCNAAQLRGLDKPFMPTLSMYTGAPGRHPNRVDKDGKPEKLTMGQGLDELIVKTHACIGASRVDRLSMFSADSWSDGLKGYEAYSLNATNKVAVICDPDAPKRYGEFVKRTAMPELRLLRGLENVRAPVAFLSPAETDLAGGHGWIHWHFTRAMRKAVATQAIPYDVICDREMKDAETLAKYPCIIFPMASCVSEAHDRVLNEVAKRGSTIVIDSYATNSYPNCVKVSSCYKNHPGLLPKTAGGPLLDWYTNRLDELKAKLTSFSSCDGGKGYTFEKEGNGVRYVMVINNQRKEREEGGGILLTFCTNDWFRPYCAAQRITTTVRNVQKGAGVYVFNGEIGEVDAERDGTTRTFAADYGPAEARVFVITPEPLEAPKLELAKGTADNVKLVKVRIETGSGKLAPNRTVLRVKVTDPDGRVTDETGDYECVGGQCEIPIRIADGDPESGFFSKWKVEVTDLVTGESESARF